MIILPIRVFMKKIKLPNPIVMVIGGLGAFWIADIINPGFNPVGVMLFMLIPVLIIEFLYPQAELEQLVEQAHYHSMTTPDQEPPISGDLVDDEGEAETSSDS